MYGLFLISLFRFDFLKLLLSKYFFYFKRVSMGLTVYVYEVMVWKNIIPHTVDPFETVWLMYDIHSIWFIS